MKHFFSRHLSTMLATVSMILLANFVHAQADTKQSKKPAAKKQNADPVVPTPTIKDVAYGEHERHRLDFWKAESNTPTPLVFVIHGGGWTSGSKERVGRFVNVEELLKNGISVVSISYRYTSIAQAAKIEPPVKAPLEDAARALQFVRSKSNEWNIDKSRIGATGGSAGACSSLWLAFHNDLAQPESSDAISRESTRLWCAAVSGAQTSLDPKQMKEWTPNSKYGAHAFGITVPKGENAFEKFLADRERILPWIAEYSPYELVSKDDPEIYLSYGAPPALGQEEKDPTHSANFGLKLQEHCKAMGVTCSLQYPGAKDVEHKNITSFLIAKLKAAR